MQNNIQVHGGEYRSQWDIVAIVGMLLAIITFLGFISSVVPTSLTVTDSLVTLTQ